MFLCKYLPPSICGRSYSHQRRDLTNAPCTSLTCRRDLINAPCTSLTCRSVVVAPGSWLCQFLLHLPECYITVIVYESVRSLRLVVYFHVYFRVFVHIRIVVALKRELITAR
jgi:hypothetical protein